MDRSLRLSWMHQDAMTKSVTLYIIWLFKTVLQFSHIAKLMAYSLVHIAAYFGQ